MQGGHCLTSVSEGAVDVPIKLTVTAKGQVTLRRAVLEHLGVKPGDQLGVALLPGGKAELTSIEAGHDLASLLGVLHRPGRSPVSLEEMQDAIESGACE